MDCTQCRFGRWYYGAGKLLYGNSPKFQTIGTLHDQIHALSQQLVTAYAHKNHTELADFMENLQAQEQAMFDAVTNLIVSRLL
jgi:hypothetical protein